MSKYDELADVAIDYSENHFATKRECQQLAHKIAKGYQEYLEAPSESMKYIVLNASLEASEKQEQFGVQAPIVKGDDNYWYFAIMLMLKSLNSHAFMQEIIHIGIKCSEKTILIKCGNKFEIPKTKPLDFQNLYSFLFEDSKERLSKGKPSKNIGFIVN